MQEQINNSNTNHIQQNDASSMTLKDLFFKYIRFLPLIILSVALALFIAFIYLRYSTPVYRAVGTLSIKSESNYNSNDRFENIFMPSGAQNVQSEIEILKSMPLMARVVRALNLQVTYFAIGKIKSPNVYKQAPFTLEVFSVTDSAKSFTLNIKFKNENEFRINNESNIFTFGQVFQNSSGVFRLTKKPGMKGGKEFDVNWQPVNSAAAAYAGGVGVTPKTVGTGILNISIETPNPELGADIINELMIQYQEASVEQKQLTAVKTLEFIDDRLALLERQLDSVKRILLAFQQANQFIDFEQQTTLYFNKLGETDNQIMQQNLKENTAAMIEDYLTNTQYNFNKVPSSLNLEDPTLNALILEYNMLQQTRKNYLDAKIPRLNVTVKDIEDRIERARQNLLENLKNIRLAFQDQIQNLRVSSNAARAEVQAMPAKVQQWLEIKRQVDIKEELYKLLMETQAETAISQASTISNSTLLNPALPNRIPVKPNRRGIQIMAVLIGFGLPALIIFALEALNDKITTRFDIERLTQAPVLGEIGHSYSESTLIVNKTNRGMVAEQFRIIRSNLQYVLNKIDKPVLLVTSSFSGEGKSFVSTNLGSVMALAGKKTIILEFDIRKPKILTGLKVPRRAGITNFLLGKEEIQNLPVMVPGHENLYVVGCGPVPPNPAELLLEPRVSELFAYLKDNFDVILIDTAPIGMVSDAMTLSKFANATLYIVRQGHTFKKQVGLIDEFYRESKLPKISIIINDVKIKPGYGYYGYGRYGYGYGYGGGYYEEETRPATFTSKIFRWMDIKRWGKKRKRSSTIA